MENVFKMRKKIIIIRHTESVEDIDKTVYARTPDPLIPLTELGFQQARELGEKIWPKIVGSSVYFYVSSEFLRIQQTVDHVVSTFSKSISYKVIYEERLAKQNWGIAIMGSRHEYERERYRIGVLDYRFPQGESGSDVVQRFKEFLQELDNKFNQSDFSDTVIFVTHGSEMRLLLMALCGWEPSYVEKLACPRNGEIATLELTESGIVNIDYEARIYNPSDNPNHVSKETKPTLFK